MPRCLKSPFPGEFSLAGMRHPRAALAARWRWPVTFATPSEAPLVGPDHCLLRSLVYQVPPIWFPPLFLPIHILKSLSVGLRPLSARRPSGVAVAGRHASIPIRKCFSFSIRCHPPPWAGRMTSPSLLGLGPAHPQFLNLVNGRTLAAPPALLSDPAVRPYLPPVIQSGCTSLIISGLRGNSLARLADSKANVLVA
jgi:hypothetical protein